MSICNQCGKQVNDDFAFCNYCGAPIHKEEPQRKTVFEGTIYKCPNCGEVITTFTAICPSCNHELQNRKSSSSVTILIDNLNMLDKSEPPRKLSITEKIFGENQAVNQRWAESNREKKNKLKEQLIKNFYLPNTVEDIIEFMFLANTNIDNEKDPGVKSAWKDKARQAYDKAKISFGNTEQFRKAKVIYKQITDHTKKEQHLLLLKITAFIVIFFIIMFAVSVLGRIEDGKIEIGISSDDIIGQEYTAVIDILEAHGFYNIKLVEEKDLIIGWFAHENEISRITIDGDDEFLSSDKFFAEDEVIIFYHAFK